MMDALKGASYYLVLSLGAFLFLGSTVPPATYLIGALQHQKGRLEEVAETVAGRLTELVTTNPEMWVFERDRIEAVMHRSHGDSLMLGLRFYIADDDLVMETGNLLAKRNLRVSHPVMDSGREIGRIEVVAPLRPALYRAGMLLAVTLVLAFAFFMFTTEFIKRTLGKSEAKERDYRLKLGALASRLNLVRESERRSLANLLHDEVGQLLAIGRREIEEAEAAESSGDRIRNLSKARRLLSDSIAQVRKISWGLSPPALYEMGLEAAMANYCRGIQEQHGINVTFRRRGLPLELPSKDTRSRQAAFRALRELLNNVIKHAGAKNIAVEISQEEGYFLLNVSDDGRGFPGTVEDHLAKGGFGLFSIREDLRSLGGVLTFGSSSQGGASVSVAIPRPAKGEKRHPE